ncbi:DUF2185 domain-containing protein [Exiguobacterium sp. PFWT01]|uniref:immunity protein Imm33 domain-containing protein n=1 Tax=Exiguobacterium sp. PFWT01 TaxID=2829816 RepID=UPI001BA840B0|nr:DUF2185 domain-containing protein [Exiguobacterium sp. PFWT01]QUP87104.1 DUF2185 domain-containing protein [Exiguobacterium sp. PFWT01]
MNWYLDDAHALHRAAPYTFYIPSTAVLSRLKVDDYVKLIFATDVAEPDGYRGERMWVRITSVNGNQFEGVLDNEPYRLPITLGTVLSFGMEHICQTELEDPAEDEWDYYMDTLVTVSADVLEREEFHFMLRDEPHEKGDSGWSFLSGYEDDAYLNDADHFHIVSIGVILNIDDSILTLVKQPPLCVYERNEDGTFQEIEDFDWDGYLNG